MFDINDNASQSLSATARYEEGERWNSKGMRLLPWILVGMVPGIGLAPVVFAIDSPNWRTAVVVTQPVFAAAQIAVLARMPVCLRRARRIWAGMR